MMKKLLFLALLFVTLGAAAQNPQVIGNVNTMVSVPGTLNVGKLFFLPNRTDTLFNPGGPGALVFAYGQAWLYTGSAWAQMTGIAWGLIPGNITAQHDLDSALNTKQTLITNGYGWKLVGNSGTFDSANVRKVDTVGRVNDSTLFFAINGHTYSVLLRGTAAGASVLGITLNTPAGLFVSNVTYTSDGAGHWSGTLSLSTQSANNVLAGPSSGSPAAPTFRQLTTSDLPTGIPNGNLANPSLGLSIGSSGTVPNFSATTVALGNTIVLNLPVAATGVTGILSASDWARFNAAAAASVASVNGQTGVVITLNADSLGSFPIDFSTWRQGYVLTVDSVHNKLVFAVGGAGSGITSLNGLSASVQTFANGFTGTSPNWVSTGSVHTLEIPIVSALDTGLVTPAQKATWDGKQAAGNYLTGLNGDVTATGPGSATATVIGIQGKPVSSTAPSTNQILQFNGTQYVPVAVPTTDSGLSSRPVAGLPSVPLNVTHTLPRFIQWDSSRLSGNPAAIITQAGLQKVVDSMLHISDTVPVLSLGQPGDTNVIAAGSSILTRAYRDSLNFHHVINPDGSVTYYSTGGGGGSQTLQQTFDQQAKRAVLPSADTVDNGSNTLIHTGTIAPVNNGAIDLGIGATNEYKTIHGHNFTSTGNWTGGAGTGDTAKLQINGNSGFSVLPNRQVRAPLYISPSAVPGTAVAGLAVDTSGNVITTTPPVTITDRTFLAPLYQQLPYAMGLASSANVSGYTAQSVDSVPYPLSSAAGADGAEAGGWVVGSTSGDSILVAAPIGVAIGNSIIAGHNALHSLFSRLEKGTGNFDPNYPDSLGQITYRLDSLTGFHWYNHGIGEQTMLQIAERFPRDALGWVQNPNDGRGVLTLSHRPQWIILEGGINDVFAGRSDSAIQRDFEECFAFANQAGIPMTVLTIVGDGANTMTVPMMRQVMRLNTWLLSPALKHRYGINVVDIFARWASGTTFGRYLSANNSPNFPSSLISSDAIHFLAPGYDSVGYDIFRSGLPTVTKMVISTPIAGTNPIANFNRPNAVRISNTQSYINRGNPFSGPASYASIPVLANDTVSMTAPLGDSVWIVITGSTNVTGSSTQTGISSLQFKLDNNPTNAIWTTAPLPSTGIGSSPAFNQVSIFGREFNAAPGTPSLDMYLYDRTTHALQVYTNAAGAVMELNSGATPYQNNSATFTIGGSSFAGVALGTTGSVMATGTGQGNLGSEFGSIYIGGTVNTTSVYALSNITGKGLTLQENISGYNASNGSLITIENTNEAAINLTPGLATNGLLISMPSSTNNSTSSIFRSVYVRSTDSDFSATGTGKVWLQMAVTPRILGAVNTTVYDFLTDSAITALNPTKGNTLVGSMTDNGSKFQVTGTGGKVETLSGLVGPPSTYTVMVHGSDSNTYQVPASSIAAASPVIFSQTANGTALTNSTTATSILGTGTGSLVIPANTLQAGQTLTIHGFLSVSTLASSPGNLTLGLGIGGASVSSFVTPLPANITSQPVEYTQYITILTTGSGGTAASAITVVYYNNAPLIAAGGGVGFSINTTVSNTLSIIGQFSVASTSNSVQTLPPFSFKLQ